MTVRIPSWSFSRLQVFESCKYRAALQWRDKVPDLQPKTAADRGTAIHQEAEDYVVGKDTFTHNLRFFKDDLTALKKHYAEGRVVCEEEWAFNTDWGHAEWKRGWLRLKCDAVCFLDPTHAVVIDYKTGKRFGNEVKHAEQLQLYAVCALLRYPQIEHVTCELWYFDQNELASFKMKRSQMPKYLKQFNQRGHAFTNEIEFKPNPNIYSCKYCPYGPAKQGDCAFGVDPNNPTGEKPLIQQLKPIALNDAQKSRLARFL
jgi:RecB family exonuclease